MTHFSGAAAINSSFGLNAAPDAQAKPPPRIGDWLDIPPSPAIIDDPRPEQHVDVRTILGDIGLEGHFRVKPSMFPPTDAWTLCMTRGLQEIETVTGNVREPGVGAGAFPAYLLHRHPGIARYVASDINPEAAEIVTRNMQAILGDTASKFEALPGCTNLLLQDAPDMRYHFALGCLPQVAMPEKHNLSPSLLAELQDGRFVSVPNDPSESEAFRALADLYVPEGNGVVRQFDDWGLNLNARFLEQLREHQDRGDRVLLNLGGRVPEGIHVALFETFGYKPKVVYQTSIRQDIATDFSAMCATERAAGVLFRFFGNPDCTGQAMSACDAYPIFARGEPVYHEMRVMLGVKR